MVRKLIPALLLFSVFLLLPTSEAKADAIVIPLSQPGTYPLILPQGQVITSVTYTADYTITITRPCTFVDRCDSPSTILRVDIFVNGSRVFNSLGTLVDPVTTGTFTRVFNPEQFDNFTFGSVSLEIDGHRTSTVLSNGVLTIQTEPAPVPEPATLLLFGSGLAGVISSAARRRRAKAG